MGHQHESKKQKVQRALQEEKAGLERSDPTVSILTERRVSADPTTIGLTKGQFDRATAELLEEAKKEMRAAATTKKKKSKLSQRNAVRKQKRNMFVYTEENSDEEARVRKEREERHLEARGQKSAAQLPKTSDGFQYFDEDMGTGSDVSDSESEEVPVALSTVSAAAPDAMDVDTTSTRKPTVKVSEIKVDAPKTQGVAVQGGGFTVPLFKAAPSSKNASSLAVSLQANPFSAAAPKTLGTESESGHVSGAPVLNPEMKKQLDRAHELKVAALNAKRASNPSLPSGKRHPAYYVLVDRTEEIQHQRSELPITMEEQQIVEKILENDVVIICGETGSGKTTQLPQFLYEAGFGDPKSRSPGMIGVTEPRRVAAVSTAQRVAAELNQRPPSLEDDSGDGLRATKQSKARKQQDRRTEHVSYQIRYDSTSNPDTRIKFMTDGILLREIQADFLLSRYSAIVIDEAHERTMNTDILLGLLCRIVPLRRQLFEEEENRGVKDDDRQAKSPLKLIIMSATLRVADFTSNRRMFPSGPPPVISIGSRQYPVTVHFNRRTPITGYIQEAFKKVVKIHTTLPAGGVLVFVTGQQEVEYLCNKLRSHFEQRMRRLKRGESEPIISESEIADETAALELGGDEEAQDHLPEDERALRPSADATTAADTEGDDTEDGAVALDAEDDGSESEEDAVLELVESMMKSEESAPKTREELKKQRREAKANVKAAALEEMDCLVLPLYSMLPPKQQMKVFEAVPANTRLIVVATNIAETSLTIPGISYVVDTGRVKNKVYDKASGMSRYKIDWIAQSAANQRAGRAGRTGPGHCYRLYSSAVFQELPDFPTPDILMIPIEEVVLQMKNMGIGKIESFPFPTPPDVHSLKTALTTLINIGAVEENKKTKEQTITPLGKSMSRFPVHPRFAKMLILGHQGQCINYIVSIVSCLAVGDPFLVDANPASVSRDRSELWKPFASQTSDLLSALSAIGAYEFAEDKEEFCHKFKLHSKTMKEIRMLRWQLTNLLNQQKSTLSEQIDFEARPPPPSRDQKVLLRQILAAGFVDHIARRVPDTNEAGEEISGKWKYVTGITSQEAHIHPSSFLYKIRPEWVVYKELIETNKVYLKGVTAVLLDWMTSLGPWLCSGMDEIVESPGPRYDGEKDKIRGFVQPSFIHKDWITTKLQVDLKGLDVFKYFARFLLEGQICPAMKPFARKMVAKPSIIVKQWAQHKIAAIVQPLLDHKIDTKQKLLAKWQKDPKFLLQAVLLWLDPSEHAAMAKIWPPTK
eukprot:TRINITY_DN2999_c0_g1_i2.p1 TRINITY_DN2999_c0_g1~~TRINITY_DN2999_c0_g1_i2.p1  ORF type:complete len:1269 (-),score=258.86 TRINITY_DN2999_c0_g1_i2:1728-5534(-)